MRSILIALILSGLALPVVAENDSDRPSIFLAVYRSFGTVDPEPLFAGEHDVGVTELLGEYTYPVSNNAILTVEFSYQRGLDQPFGYDAVDRDVVVSDNQTFRVGGGFRFYFDK